MARTGLRQIETRFAFVSSVIAVQKGWSAQGMDAQKRARAIVDAANKALASYQVPVVAFLFQDQSSPFAAEFGHQEWRIALDRRAFQSKGAPSVADMAELVDAVYHESRHAEQWFLAARYRLGEGWSTQDLAKFFLKPSVAQAAKGLALSPGSPEEGLAERLAACLLSKQGINRMMETLRDLDALEEGSKATAKEKEEARKRLEKLGYLKGTTNDAKRLRARAHRAYQSQLPEADAWDTGRLAAELFKHQAWMTLPKAPVKVV